jgi:hypothetical protein
MKTTSILTCLLATAALFISKPITSRITALRRSICSADSSDERVTSSGSICAFCAFSMPSALMALCMSTSP